MNQDGNTALIYASIGGHADVVSLLLDRGAPIDIGNKVCHVIHVD